MTRLRMGHCGLAGGLVRESHLPSCECYDGRLGKCQRFLIECSLAFELQPSSFPTNRSKVALIIFLFSGKALDWAPATWERQAPVCENFHSFTNEVSKVFNHPRSGQEGACVSSARFAECSGLLH
ncbi:hypothetical protein SKAU_G00035460 [Synaphobranchus kaupii]|uniref:DUF4939 domain-containing protein n=1 Tax=Synaphobranchus kaupii TaxID=118154 RepID=A0A9Q1JEP3_SYNKA|nr:hypothetical protein SKAU_G00035460 [Synaphobranchus kaupii]